MSEQPNIYLTVYGLTASRAGLVRSMLRTRNVHELSSEVTPISSWIGIASHKSALELLESLQKLGDLSFQAELTLVTDRECIVYTPELGLGSALIDSFGNITLSEHRLLKLVRDANQNMLVFERMLGEALLAPWQLRFESIRQEALVMEQESSRTSVA